MITVERGIDPRLPCPIEHQPSVPSHPPPCEGKREHRWVAGFDDRGVGDMNQNAPNTSTALVATHGASFLTLE